MMKARTLLLPLVAALLAGCAAADNTNTGNANATKTAAVNNANGNTASTPQSRSATLSDADREFLMAAAQGGTLEVELGRLAQTHAASAAVKQFGQHMIDDHGKANGELKQLAAAKGVSLPTEMKSEHREMMDKLSKLRGAEFDREYMSGMVEDHEKDVKEFQEQSQDGGDAEVKAFATKTLPTLQQHLQMAREIAGKK